MPQQIASVAQSTPPRTPRHWPMWVGVAIGAALARLPRPFQAGLGTVLGAVLYRLARGRRRVVEVNLALCFPERSPTERRALVRAHFAEVGRGFFEFLRAWWGSLGGLSSQVRWKGLEHLHAAQDSGRGVILLSGHFLHFELCGRLLCQHARAAAMYRPMKSPVLDWAVRKGRLRYADAVFPRDSLRPAVRYLRSSGVLWFAPDQDSLRGESVFVPFFGRAAWSLTSTHQLARLSGAKVIPFRHRRTPGGRGFEIELGEPLADFPSPDPVADTARVMAEIEAMIRRAPAEYL
ncbi:MAG: lipid A biosynthesis lauroyl acyltransferase, partial [Gammaproteobacteria bacterium HGW-Gammaproteobacteria-7]